MSEPTAISRRYVDDQYVLPADQPEGERLNTQYDIIKIAFAGRVKLAPVELKDGDRVLDVATGTGIWTLDMASISPSTIHFDAFDISTHLFPSSAPPNTHFLQHSVLDLPASWTNTFSLINQRLLGPALTRADWSTAIHTLFRVLKPGGYIQLVEFDGRCTTPNLKCGPHSTLLMGIIERLFPARGLLLETHDVVPGLVRAAGFEQIEMERVEIPMDDAAGDSCGQSAVRNRMNCVNVYRSMKGPILKANAFGLGMGEGGGMTGEEYDKMMEGAEREWAADPKARIPFWSICARKPL